MKKLEKLSNGMFNALPNSQMGNVWGGQITSSHTRTYTTGNDTINTKTDTQNFCDGSDAYGYPDCQWVECK